MPIGIDQIKLLAIKQASQGAAAMAAAAKQVPSALPVPTFVPPAQPGEDNGAEDTAKAEEAHRKEIERKDKELAALRNNAQVMQMQLAHQKALANLDRHRDQIYKSIEKKEEDHRRHMEKEDAALQQRKERMQADEIKHQAKMDVISAQQHARAAEDQAKLTAQNAQQSARDYMKMTADAQRAADNYFGQKSKDFEKRQKELDAQQKALDAQGSRISPIVMNSLQNAVKATSGLGDIRSKLQATPGIVHSHTYEMMPKVAATYVQEDPKHYFTNTKPELQALRKAQQLYASGDTQGAQAAYLDALAQQQGRTIGQQIATGGKKVTDTLGDIDSARALTMQRAADEMQARQRKGEQLSQEELVQMKAYQNAADRMQNYYKSIANNPNASEAERLKAKGELATLGAYTQRTANGLLGKTQSTIGSWLGHPEWGTRSAQDEAQGKTRSFLGASTDMGAMMDWTTRQGSRAIDDIRKGNYLSAGRKGIKALLGISAMPTAYVAGLGNRVATLATGGDKSGNLERMEQVAKTMGTRIGNTGVMGGNAAQREATRRALTQADLNHSRAAVLANNVGDTVLELPWLGGLKALKFIKPLRTAAKSMPAVSKAVNAADKTFTGNWKRTGATIAGTAGLSALPFFREGQGSAAVQGASEALSAPAELTKGAAAPVQQGQEPPAPQPQPNPTAGYTVGKNEQGGDKLIGGTRPGSFVAVNSRYANDEFGSLRRRKAEEASPIRSFMTYAAPALAMFGIDVTSPKSPYQGYNVPIMLDRITNAAYNTPAAQRANNPYGLTEEGRAMYNAYGPTTPLADRIGMNPIQGSYGYNNFYR